MAKLQNVLSHATRLLSARVATMLPHALDSISGFPVPAAAFAWSSEDDAGTLSFMNDFVNEVFQSVDITPMLKDTILVLNAVCSC